MRGFQASPRFTRIGQLEQLYSIQVPRSQRIRQKYDVVTKEDRGSIQQREWHSIGKITGETREEVDWSI